MELLTWLVDFEHLSINYTGNTMTEKAEEERRRGQIMEGNTARTEMIQNCIDFDNI
jgi:hypothetical protein